jgi:hypothetical protein
MDEDLAAYVREMRDRQEIYDCLMRYCRGIDRFDRALAVSAYHPDALDDHGAFVGPADQFIDFAIALHTRHQRRTQHHITNHICRIEGDAAETESYYIFRSLNLEAPWHSITSGRYIDRLEKRGGMWGIVARICTVDIRNEHWDPTGQMLDGPYMTTSRSGEDPSYMRPVAVDPARFTQHG